MIIKTLVSLLLTIVVATAYGQTASQSGELAGTRPNAGGAPDEITVRVGLLDIAEINDREQVFVVNILVHIGWHDPRLAAETSDADLRTVSLDTIWDPRLTVVNNRGLESLLPNVATIDSEGNVLVRLRLTGPLGVDLDLREFPFDSQRLPIEIVSYQYSPAEIRFSADSEMVLGLDQQHGDAWGFELLEPQTYEYRLRQDVKGGAGLTFAVVAVRESSYYIYTLALPMTLILFLAWMAHWLPVDVIPSRMGTASATIFSLITFGVGFRLTLPKITYLTVADRFVLYSTMLVFVSLAIIVLTIRWAENDRRAAAERLARSARFGFPVLYGIVILLTLAA